MRPEKLTQMFRFAGLGREDCRRSRGLATLGVAKVIRGQAAQPGHAPDGRLRRPQGMAIASCLSLFVGSARRAGLRPPAQAPLTAKLEIGWSEASAASSVNAFSSLELPQAF